MFVHCCIGSMHVVSLAFWVFVMLCPLSGKFVKLVVISSIFSRVDPLLFWSLADVEGPLLF